MNKLEYIEDYNRKLRTYGSNMVLLDVVGETHIPDAATTQGFMRIITHREVSDTRFLADAEPQERALEMSKMSLRAHLNSEIDRGWRDRELPNGCHVFQVSQDNGNYCFRFEWR